MQNTNPPTNRVSSLHNIDGPSSPKDNKGSPRLVVSAPPHGRVEAAFTTQMENTGPLENRSLPGNVPVDLEKNRSHSASKLKQMANRLDFTKTKSMERSESTRRRANAKNSWRERTTEFFKKGLGSTLDYKNKKTVNLKKKNQPTPKEALLYFFFILLFTIIVFMGRSDGPAFYFNNMIRGIFLEEEFNQDDSFIKKNFYDISKFDEFFQWLHGPFLRAIFPENWYNGQSFTEYERKYVNGYYRRVGTARLRQLRVKPNSCSLIAPYRGVISECYGDYSEGEKDTDPFGPNDMYQYTSGNDGAVYQGRISYYDSGGYIFDLTPNYTQAYREMLDLEKNLWLDLHTRAVFVDFTLYNGNINYFCVVRFVVEFPATGGALPYATVRTVKLYSYETAADWALAVFEILFIIFVFYYLFEEISEMKENGLAYCREFWNYVDILNILIFIIVAIFHIMTLVLLKDLSYNPKNDTNQFIDFQTVAFFIDQERNINAANAFLCWFKIFKYIRISTRLSQLTDTLSNASIDILVFLGIFFIVFFGYAQAAWMIFGNDMAEFRSLIQSIFTLFRCILGDFNFHMMEQTNRYLGPSFFISFQVLVFFILINMFLAIINDSYVEIKNREENKKKFQIAKYLKNSLEKIKRKLQRKKENVEEIRNAFVDADENQDGLVDEKEIERVLKQHSKGAAAIGLSAKDVLNKYDKDNNMALDVEEQAQFLADLKQKEVELSNMQRFVTNEEKVNHLDHESESDIPLNTLNTLRDPSKIGRHAVQKALRRPSKEKRVDIVIDPVHDKQKLGPPGERTRIQEAMPPESESDDEEILQEVADIFRTRSNEDRDDSWILEKRMLERVESLESSVKIILDQIIVMNSRLEKLTGGPTSPNTSRAQPPSNSPGPKILPVPALNLEQVYQSPRLTVRNNSQTQLDAALAIIKGSDLPRSPSTESLESTESTSSPSTPVQSTTVPIVLPEPVRPPPKVTLPPIRSNNKPKD